MSFTSEVKRMQEIVTTLTNQTEAMLTVEYSRDDIASIINEHFPEGALAIAQGVGLYIVLKDFEKLCLHINNQTNDGDFDKVRKAIIDYETDGKFNFK